MWSRQPFYSLRLRRVLPLLSAAFMPILLASCIMAQPISSITTATQSGAGQRAYDDQSGALIPIVAPMPVPNAPALAMAMSPADRLRATVCLASAVYYEAALEPDDGKRAVAQVVLNRMRHREWPDTVCGVVYDGSDRPGCQFSFACDGAEGRRFSPAIWARSREVAERALAGEVYAPVGDATFYHTHDVAPTWRHRLQKVAVIGAHIFYRLPDSGIGPMVYRGGEAVPQLRQYQPQPTTSVASVPVAPLDSFHAPEQARVVAGSGSVSQPSATPSSPTTSQSTPQSGDVRPEWAQSGQWIGDR